MPFLAFSNRDIQFDTESFTWRFYSTAKALPIARKVEFIDKHTFAQVTLDENSETFVVHIAALEAVELAVHPSQAPPLAALQQDKAPTKIPSEYDYYADVFSLDLAIELCENTDINKYVIKLVEGKQPSYSPIFSLGPMELERLKAYIETYLKTLFIRPSKSRLSAPIIFDKKLNGSLCLYVDYRGLHNLTIKKY